MMLLEKILLRIGKNDHSLVNAGYNAIAELDPHVRSITAEILGVPYVHTKDEFEENYVADFIKGDNESDEAYQSRLSKLNESRLITAVDIKTEKKILLVTDPTQPELDNFCHIGYGIISYDAYKEIMGGVSDFSLSFSVEETIPTFIRRLFRYAHDEKATDIDLTTMQATVSIKLKVSGEWTAPIGAFPIAYKNNFLISLCSMASPFPVDYRSGKELKFRVSTNIDGVDLSFRTSIIPTAFGENVALRKLPGVGAFPHIEGLGLSDEAKTMIQTMIAQIESPKKGGVVFITGETGSGKSTLLSAIEGEYLKKQKKVSTSEDPVENKHPHPFLNQTEVGEDAGITHMDALAGFLRQNSDVIVIGECRRSDELVAVINAGLSGHYAYTTLHTGSNEETLMRLESMGVDLNMLSGVLKGIISMTLLPRLCPQCKEEIGGGLFRRGKGCEACKGRGITGVIPVGEYSMFGETTKRLIGVKQSHEIIDAIKETNGYISMHSQVERLKAMGIIDAEGMNV
ncbi:MAG: ATPase, T2SS/T4P/T4SS family [Sulfurimonas sp.]|jgi:type II secretory ATPase GspE/PulE/Tfp pilus assembly ATPase PilB-like protein